MSKFDSVKYIDEINDIDELKKEFKDLWEDYYELNKAFTNISLKYDEYKKY